MSYEVAKIDARYFRLVNDYLEGSPISQLSEKYHLPPEDISSILSRKEVKNYIAAQLANFGYLNQATRVKLLNKIVEQKLQIAEENNTPLSNKDLTEIIKLLQEEQKLTSKNQEAPEVQINMQAEYVNLISDLVKGKANEE